MSLKESEILEEHEKGFLDTFVADLDSWFNADIACCDSCYKEFLEFWPLADEAHDCEFQRSCIDLDTFYQGSKRLQESYTPAEYNVLKATLRCPRCGSEIQSNFWAYELPFSSNIDTFDFELNIEAIAAKSVKTPFLMLQDDFASQIHELIQKKSSKTKAVDLSSPLFRGRLSTKVKQLDYQYFSIAPKDRIQEGRYNHAGEQVLYLASDMLTCFYEVGEQLCYIAKCNIKIPVKILDLTNTDENYEEDESLLNALVFSALMSKKLSTNGWDKPVYVFSRFVADCAKAAGFDAIKYPSTKTIKNNFNLVIFNEKVFKDLIEFTGISLFDGVEYSDLTVHI